MGWTRLEMSLDEARGYCSALQQAFEEAWVAAGSPVEAAMLRGDPVFVDPSYYFSPAGAHLVRETLQRRGASRCAAPRPGRVEALVGRAEAALVAG